MWLALAELERVAATLRFACPHDSSRGSSDAKASATISLTKDFIPLSTTIPMIAHGILTNLGMRLGIRHLESGPGVSGSNASWILLAAITRTIKFVRTV